MKKDLHIRRAVFADLAEIQQLQARSLRELSGHHYTAAQIESLISTQTISRWKFLPLLSTPIYIAIQGNHSETGQIVGMGYLMKGLSIISGLFVHPQFARQGIGTQLLQHLERIARHWNHSSLSVTSSMVAVPFYQAAGYKTEMSYQLASQGHKIDCEYMTKPL